MHMLVHFSVVGVVVFNCLLLRFTPQTIGAGGSWLSGRDNGMLLWQQVVELLLLCRSWCQEYGILRICYWQLWFLQTRRLRWNSVCIERIFAQNWPQGRLVGSWGPTPEPHHYCWHLGNWQLWNSFPFWRSIVYQDFLVSWTLVPHE